MLPRGANLNRRLSAKECLVLFSIVQYSVPASIVVSSSIRSFQVQVSDSFKRCQSVIINDIKELGIQVLSDRQFTPGIAVPPPPLPYVMCKNESLARPAPAFCMLVHFLAVFALKTYDLKRPNVRLCGERKHMCKTISFQFPFQISTPFTPVLFVEP